MDVMRDDDLAFEGGSLSLKYDLGDDEYDADVESLDLLASYEDMDVECDICGSKMNYEFGKLVCPVCGYVKEL